jgi:leader peptidase (prepilin peptidase) / N-methyltransferase
MNELPLSLTISFAGLFGLLIGSFLNVVIHRLPKMMEREWKLQLSEANGASEEAAPAYNLVKPGSSCPHCGHAIRAWENIPLLSYALQGGRCTACRAPISLRYPVVEAATGLLAALCVWKFGATAAALGAFVFSASLLALTCIDLDTFLLPDAITLPLLWAGLFFNLSHTFASLPSAVIGAMLGYLVLWSVYWLFKLTTGKEGMGFGDFKLLAAIGAWLGWQMLPLTILGSSLVGAVVGLSLIALRRQGRDTPIPFGPYLAGAGLIALFAGKELTAGYLSLLRV